MIFDTSDGFASPIVRQKANLIEPDVRENEGAIAPFAFDLAFLQFRRLDDPLEQQFDRLFAVGE